MSFTSLAGLGGIGFVLVAIIINVIYIRAGLPLPMSGQSLDAATDAFAATSHALKGPSVPEAEQWAAQVDRADGFIFVTPEYNHGYSAVLKNAIDYLYAQWAHKPAAIVSYGGFAAGYRAAEQLRQVLIELKMVPIREQVGISLVPNWIPSVSDAPDSPSGAFLDRSFNGMMTELLWWVTALIPARERDRLSQD